MSGTYAGLSMENKSAHQLQGTFPTGNTSALSSSKEVRAEFIAHHLRRPKRGIPMKLNYFWHHLWEVLPPLENPH